MTANENGHGYAGICPDCGKRRYTKRKWARRAMRVFHPEETSMHMYRCGLYWHGGHDRRVFQPVSVEGLPLKARQQIASMAAMMRSPDEQSAGRDPGGAGSADPMPGVYEDRAV